LQFQNKGVTALTEATISAKLNGNVIASQQWTGNLEQFQSQEVSFGSYTFNTSANVIFEVTPTGTDAAPADNTITAEIVLAPEIATNDVIVSVVTDRYKSESSWRIKRSNNTTVASSPSYGADLTANGTTEHPPVTVALAANDCYRFEMVDSFGDGICCQYGEGSYTVTDANGNILFTGGQFGAIDIKSMSKGVTSIEETSSINNFSVFPNPSTGLVNLTMNLANSDDVVLKVYNTLGAIVHSHDLGNLTAGEYLYSLDLSAFANGMYKVVAVSSKGMSVNSVQVSK
jgi:hypothetical protein